MTSINYLHDNIFKPTLCDMASGMGSISSRLYKAYENYLHKIDWKFDLDLVPEIYKEEFRLLKFLLYDDVKMKVAKEQIQIKENHKLWKMHLSGERLNELSNARTVIKKMHWIKAKKISILLTTIYNDLGRIKIDSLRS